MKILGLIMEANPFHNGHKYFIEQAKAIVNPDLVIVITSTSFTMRGEISVLSKYDKTILYLKNGVDLVIELPIFETLNSANHFSYSAIKHLTNYQITDLAFGVDTINLQDFNQLLTLISSPQFETNLKIELAKHHSYKHSHYNALATLTTNPQLLELYNKPNCTLAIQYCQAIKNLNSNSNFNFNINIHPIIRIGNDYHDLIPSHQSYASATTIRSLLLNHQSVANFINYDQSLLHKYDLDYYNTKIFDLIKYQLLLSNQQLSNLLNFNEGIENYLLSKINHATNFNELLNLCKNKRYTVSRIRRTLLALLISIPQQSTSYNRILGLNQKAISYLQTLPKSFKATLKEASPKKVKNDFIYELRASRLYDLLLNTNTYQQEFLFPINYKETINE